MTMAGSGAMSSDNASSRDMSDEIRHRVYIVATRYPKPRELTPALEVRQEVFKLRI